MGKRKVLAGAVLMAVLLFQNAGTLVYAEEAVTRETGFEAGDGAADVKSELTGTIKVELISVELPVGGIEFEVDPSQPFSLANPGEQIRSPSIRIANHSVIPVKLQIAKVPEVEHVSYAPVFEGGPEQKFQLYGTLSEVDAQEYGAGILVLGTEDDIYTKEADFERCAIVPGIEEAVTVTNVEAWGTRKLKLYGKVKPDFYGDFQFTVTPMLKISAVNVTN